MGPFYKVASALFISFSSTTHHHPQREQHQHQAALVTSAKLDMTSAPNNNPNEAPALQEAEHNMSQDICIDLVEKLQTKLRSSLEEGDDQYWIGVAGGPGSGKSTIAEGVRDLLNHADDSTSSDEMAIVIPMDGWHLYKEELIEKHGMEYGYKRRGARHTFDVQKCIADLRQAKETGEASLPTYSREISDPVPDQVLLKKNSHRVVIVEGIYILDEDDPEWKPLTELFDEKWFVKAPSRDEQKRRLLQRSMKTWHTSKAEVWGKGEAGATKRMEFNDVPNMDSVSHCEQFADEVIINK